MCPTSKRVRFTVYNGDHISSLPYDVISDILSRLPTNEAVRTSVLSRNWKTRWTSIYNIDMDEKIESFSGENATASFSDVVTKVLLCTRNSRLVSFRLFCAKDGHFGSLEKWISNVFMRRVQHLRITARVIKPDSPWCFSGWGLLTELRLEMSCTLKIPADDCFPNLKKFRLCSGARGDLKIETTKCPGSDGVLLVFPVLIVFQLSHCEWLDVNSVEIQAPELVCFSKSCSRKIQSYEIKICAPKLALFELRGRGPVNNYVVNAPAVTYVALSNRLGVGTSALQAHKILTKFSNLKCLRIHGEALLALLRLKPQYAFPYFGRLTELEVKFYCAIKDVLELLQMLPPLESLIMNTWDVYEFGEVLTPKILSRLKNVKLVQFSATKGQYDFAMCLLEKALNLEKMTVYLQESALNLEEMAVGDGRIPVDMVEAIGQSLSNLKPKGARCDIVVEEEDVSSTWVGSTPRVILGIGNKHQVVY